MCLSVLEMAACTFPYGTGLCFAMYAVLSEKAHRVDDTGMRPQPTIMYMGRGDCLELKNSISGSKRKHCLQRPRRPFWENDFPKGREEGRVEIEEGLNP